MLIELEGLAGTSYRLENMLTLSSLLVKQSWNKLFLQSRTRYLFFLFGYSVKELFLLSLAQQSAAMVRLHAPACLDISTTQGEIFQTYHVLMLSLKPFAYLVLAL